MGCKMEDEDIPSKAEHLANILSGNGSTSYKASTVQRSHRFLLHQFVLIENMAKLADCSVAAMINQIIEVGLEALYDHLPQEVTQQIHKVSSQQINKSNSSVNQKIGKKPVKK